MSNSVEALRRKTATAAELDAVVRTMKAIAASNIVQFEAAAHAIDDYDLVIQLGLGASLRQDAWSGINQPRDESSLGLVYVLVLGTDQGMVGQFNDALAQFAHDQLKAVLGKKIVWVVGERMSTRLADIALAPQQRFALPGSIAAITALVSDILLHIEAAREKTGVAAVYVLHHRPVNRAIYEPVMQRLLPLDQAWRDGLTARPWPSANLPQLLAPRSSVLKALIHEYLFVSLFKAFAQSLASENAYRLAAMQRAEKNIDELLENLNRTMFRLRQSSIDEELFDLVSGFEALSPIGHPKRI